MNLVTLKTFLAVVQTGNLNKAADLLNVTQSTVTARLDALDTELGQSLLLRKGGSAYLPWRMCAPHVEAGRLHVVPDVPEFSRAVYFNWRRASAQAHSWLAHIHQSF